MQEKPKKKTGRLRNPTTELCKICGGEFLKTSVNKLTCSPECAHENAIRNMRRYREENRDLYNVYSRKYHKEHPKSRCKICGKLIQRGLDGHIKTQMHDECIYDDILATIKAGQQLTKTQYLRMQSRGWTMKEFKEEYLTNV